VVAAFFLYQKAATGWFVTPYHEGLFNEPHSILAQGWRVARSIFVDDGRIVAVGAAAILVAIRGRAALGPWDRQGKLFVAFGIQAFFNVAFFAKSFYLERYTLPAHVSTVVALAGVLAAAGGSVRVRAPGLLAGALALAVALSHRAAGDDMVSGETTFRYLHAVHANAALYRRMEAAGGSPVVLTVWPITDALREPFLGWVSRPYRCINLSDHQGEPFDRVIAVPGHGSYARLLQMAQDRGFHRIDRAEEGPASIELWGQ
jgi:hypothetical protein